VPRQSGARPTTDIRDSATRSVDARTRDHSSTAERERELDNNAATHWVNAGASARGKTISQQHNSQDAGQRSSRKDCYMLQQASCYAAQWPKSPTNVAESMEPATRSPLLTCRRSAPR